MSDRPRLEAARSAADAKVRRVELLISVLLRTGVIISVVLIVFGMLVSFVRHPDYLSSPSAMVRLGHPGDESPRTFHQVVNGLRGFRGQAFVAAGLIVLIATPVMRVAVSIVGFLYEGDRTFIVITSIVLAVLLFSFYVGKAGG